MSYVFIAVDLGNGSLIELRKILASHGYRLLEKVSLPDPLPPVDQSEKMYQLPKRFVVSTDPTSIPRLINEGYTVITTPKVHVGTEVCLRVYNGKVYIHLAYVGTMVLVYETVEGFLKHWDETVPSRGQGAYAHFRSMLLNSDLPIQINGDNIQSFPIQSQSGETYGTVWVDVDIDDAKKFINCTFER